MWLNDNAIRANQTRPFSQFDSKNPEDLWAYLAEYEARSGGEVLAIAHNGNLSSGTMFLPQHQKTGVAIDADYARMRQRFEPLLLREHYVSEADDHIRRRDVPERAYACCTQLRECRACT